MLVSGYARGYLSSSAQSLVVAIPHLTCARSAPAFKTLRRNLGRVILLGLEVLIVADIITTITIDQTPSSAITLGIVVLVRTFLSFSLEIELDGVLPWRRAALTGKGARTTSDAGPGAETEVVQRPFRVNITCVTPLGAVVASIS